MAIMFNLVLFLALFIISFTPCGAFVFNSTVSWDGNGDFKTISDAIRAAPNNSQSRFYIRVKSGTYNEHVEVDKDKTFIALIGDDASTTIIVDHRSNKNGFGTAQSATFVANGYKFMAQSITFQNSAGPENGQAVALLSYSSYTTYFKCVFLGYQDTQYVNGKNVFFKDCEIYGTVDFIFGGGLAVFQDCQVYARLLNRTVTVTAQSKEAEKEQSGFSFQNCSVMASPELDDSRRLTNNFEVYLGRPWREYSTVIFMQSFLDSMVNPAGWSAWSENGPLNLLFYAEFNNRGPGANSSARVKWAGFHEISNPKEVEKFTVRNFINGTTWLPETGVPFRPDL